MRVKKILSVSLILFLLFPFLFLIYEFRHFTSPDWNELVWAFKNSFIQAFFSAFFSIVTGLFIALGLTSFSTFENRSVRNILEILCLIPNFLPPLFVLLAVLNGVDGFPMGLSGVIFIHTLMNAGLVGVMIAQVIEQKASGLDELSYIEGARRWKFIAAGLFPLIRRDLLFAGLFVFTICFSSFSIPLIVGGGRGTTIEVLIYEKMRLSNEWGGAVLLAFIQSTFMFLLALSLKGSSWQQSVKKAPLRLSTLRLGILPLLLISILLLYGYLQGVLVGGAVGSQFYGLQSVILNAVFGSLWVSFSSGTLTFIFLLVIAYCWPQPQLENFLKSYVAPSTALACFALLMAFPNESIFPFLKIPIAFLMLNLTGLFRLGWSSQLESLKGQYEVARIMGASSKLTFQFILLPQIIKRAGLLSGIAAVWSCGDFAISRVLAHRDLTLAMVTETLMSSYRLHQAAVLSLGLIVLSLFSFSLFIGVSYVLRRKLMP